MKYILVNHKDIIIYISDTLNFQENGNYLIDNDTLAITPDMVKNAYPYQDSISSEIIPYKYCYSEKKGFYKNIEYKRIYSIEERIEAIEDTINMLLGFEEEA